MGYPTTQKNRIHRRLSSKPLVRLPAGPERGREEGRRQFWGGSICKPKRSSVHAIRWTLTQKENEPSAEPKRRTATTHSGPASTTRPRSEAREGIRRRERNTLKHTRRSRRVAVISRGNRAQIDSSKLMFAVLAALSGYRSRGEVLKIEDRTSTTTFVFATRRRKAWVCWHLTTSGILFFNLQNPSLALRWRWAVRGLAKHDHAERDPSVRRPCEAGSGIQHMAIVLHPKLTVGDGNDLRGEVVHMIGHDVSEQSVDSCAHVTVMA